MSDDIDRILAAISADRRELGTIDDDPLSPTDIAFSQYVALVLRFKRGDAISARERAFLARMLFQTSTEMMISMTRKHASRTASQRGGLARKADASKIEAVWTEHYRAEGKKYRADELTADDCGVSITTVKRVRRAGAGHK